MRAPLVLVGSLTLLLVSCSSKSHAPPPLHKEWLSGKWQNVASVQFLTTCEFGEDGSAKIAFQDMQQPVAAHYTWSGERTLDLQYQAPAEVQQAYKAAAKTYKADLVERGKTGKINERAVLSLSSTARDELPPSDSFQVSISDEPRLLFLNSAGGMVLTLERAD